MNTSPRSPGRFCSIPGHGAAVLAFCILAFAPVAFASGGAQFEQALRRAEKLLTEQKPAEAHVVLEGLREAHDTDPRIPFLLAQCDWNLWRADRSRTTRLESARAHIQSALELQKPFPVCSFVSGMLEMDAMDFEAAIRGFRQALAGGY